jgi:hypothetical protein
MVNKDIKWKEELDPFYRPSTHFARGFYFDDRRIYLPAKKLKKQLSRFADTKCRVALLYDSAESPKAWGDALIKYNFETTDNVPFPDSLFPWDSLRHVIGFAKVGDVFSLLNTPAVRAARVMREEEQPDEARNFIAALNVLSEKFGYDIYNPPITKEGFDAILTGDYKPRNKNGGSFYRVPSDKRFSQNRFGD